MIKTHPIINHYRYFHSIAGNKLIVNFFASVIVTIFDSIGIGFLVAIFQYGLAPESASGNSILNLISDILGSMGITDINMGTLIFISVLVFTAKAVITLMQMRIQAVINSQILNDTRVNLLQKITNLKYTAFINTDAGTIQNICTTEVQRLYQAMLGYFNTIQYLVMCITYLILAFITEYRLTIIIIIAGLIIQYYYKYIFNYFKKLSAVISSRGNSFNSYLTQLLQNYKYLKATGEINPYEKRIISDIRESEKLSLKIWRTTAWTSSIREPVILIIVGLIMLAQYKITGELNTYSLFCLVLFYRILNYLLLSQNHWQQFNQFSGSIYNILNVREMLSKNQESGTFTADDAPVNNLELQNVNLEFNNYRILNNINLRVPRHATVAIAGKSGSGKTTLVSVLAGLITPDSGKYLINNRSLSEINIHSFRKKIGYVAQDPVIFNDTIFNNITLWAEKTQKNLEKFHSILSAVHLENLLEQSADREDTPVGDQGIILSGGQKQRLSIGRELFRNVEILILDEATSSLDSATEQIVQQNLDALSGTMTIIVIAHRLSTIKKADIIYLMENGTIRSYGDFDTLHRDSELFRNMVQLQTF